MFIRLDISSNELLLLNFFVKQPFVPQKAICNQINNSTIKSDISPFYCIIKFDVNKKMALPLSEEFVHSISFDVIHSNNSIPSCFNLHIRDGYIYEFEAYNADSSKINYDEMCEGNIIQIPMSKQ